MKVCPRCQKTYTDDNLNFCLEDGSVLQQAAAQPTIQMSAPQVSQANQPQPTHPSAQAGWNVPPQGQQYSMQPQKKSSKAWIWVLLILGAVILLCGGGFAGLMYLGIREQQRQEQANLTSANSTRTNTTTRNSSTSTNSTTTTSDSGRADMDSVDLEGWVKEFSAYGNTKFENGEFQMSAKQKGFYYVLVAPEEYQTENADTRVTLRNMDNAASSLGYGLIFHSNPTPLQQDYAFLIDTKRKKYRVVNHAPSKESSVVTWTTSTAIKEGAEPNVLEARDFTDRIDLYINGTKVTSIKNVHGYKGGVAGLYSGDGIKIAFKDLEIRK